MRALIKTRCFLFIAIPVIFFVIGCDQGGDPSKDSACYITKITTTQDANTEALTLTYSSDKKTITAVDVADHNGTRETDTYTITADNDGNIIKIAIQSNAGNYDDFLYNSNSQIIQRNEYNANVLAYQIDYDYNASGQLRKIKYSDLSSGSSELEGYSLFEYKSTSEKNPVRQKYFGNDGTLLLIAHYTYDDKKLSFGKLAPLFETYSENNVTKISYEGGAGVFLVLSFALEYNEKGYPTKSTETDGNGESVEQIYTYDCH